MKNYTLSKQEVTIQPVTTKKALKAFIKLPSKIHQKHNNWVPPIYMDERVFFNSGKNEAFQYCDTILLLAFRGKDIVGRIMGIINHKYNEPHGLKEARFAFFECYDEAEAANRLIAAVEDWAKANHMDSLVGPLGFSDKDPQGFLVEGFDEPITIACNCNFPYMVKHLTRLNFNKKTDLVVYKLEIPPEIPEFYQRIYERALQKHKNLRVVHFTSRRQMKKYVRPVLELVNETFKDIYAFNPLSEKEMDEFANRYIFLLDPRFLKVVENEMGEVVAFILGMADISSGIQKCKGYLLPFGIIQLFRAKRNTDQLNLLLGGIKETYRNNGMDSLLGVSLLKSAWEKGMKTIDSHLELESNTKMRAEMEKMGGCVYKRYRIFQKSI